MRIDDGIVRRYLAGESLDADRQNWIYRAVGQEGLFSAPDPKDAEWVAKLRDKLAEQIYAYVPRNYEAVKAIFPAFDEVASNFSIMLVVGFPDPYEAMMLESPDGESVMVFDLIRFGEKSLKADYSCHRVLTHELIHMCLHRDYPQPKNPTYRESMDYIVFDEGFAHALTYPEDMGAFDFDIALEERFRAARDTLGAALSETNSERRREFLAAADTGRYWDKFGAIAGKLYLLKHINEIGAIYRSGWNGISQMVTAELP
jgi:hypothetical protein